MLADYRVCLDADVLANYGVSDLLFRLAEKPRIYTPVFSRMILGEVRRTHVEKLGWGEEIADTWQAAICDAFPEAIVEGFEPLIENMTNHEKDRHVVAAALAGRAQLIVTFNLKDFQSEHLECWAIEAQHPQDYLIKGILRTPTILVLESAAIQWVSFFSSFYTFPEAKAVITLHIDNASPKLPVTTKVALFQLNTSEEGIAKWLNNQHSDGLYIDPAKPIHQEILPEETGTVTERKLLGEEKSPTNDAVFADYKVKIAIKEHLVPGKYEIPAFTVDSKVFLKSSSRS